MNQPYSELLLKRVMNSLNIFKNSLIELGFSQQQIISQIISIINHPFTHKTNSYLQKQ